MMHSARFRPGKVIEVRQGQTIRVDGGRVCITLEHKSGQVARLRIVAPESAPIEAPEREKKALEA